MSVDLWLGVVTGIWLMAAIDYVLRAVVRRRARSRFRGRPSPIFYMAEYEHLRLPDDDDHGPVLPN